MEHEQLFIIKSGIGYLERKSIPAYMTTDPIQAVRFPEDEAVEWKNRLDKMGLDVEIIKLNIGRFPQQTYAQNCD
jgi:hypothetical protein